MTLTSIEFFLFSFLILCLYYFVSGRGQNYLLLIASTLFLISWNLQFAFVYIILTTANFVLGQRVGAGQKSSRYALFGGIVINLLALAFFKYANFFLPSALQLLQTVGFTAIGDGLSILLPIGLSFFVVQAISYLMDINRGLVLPAADFVEFAVYMAYFPRVVSGPIERFRELSPILNRKRVFNRDQIGDGLVLILQGLIRKVVIANLLFILLPLDVFSDPVRYSSLQLVLWLLVYTFALYNDFAGYTSMARGVSALFGIPLSINFNIPFLAQSFSEFWQRWHITLSNWLRDYIYMPVTRALLRRKYGRTHALSIVIPPMTTMLISGLWHDISWNMLLWGGMHGAYLVGERVLALTRPVKANKTSPVWKQMLGVGIVFSLTTLAWVPFRTPAVWTYWTLMFSPVHWSSSLSSASFSKFTLGLIALSILLDLIHVRWKEQALQRCPVFVQAVIVNLALFSLILASIVQNRPPAFVYQGF
jgi:alginate O-acetyltransferase complex protein AlgI